MLTSVLIAAVSLALFWMAAFTLWWQMHAWRTPEVLASTRFSSPDGGEHLSFSLLLPARHEQAVLDHTLHRLLDRPPRLRDHRHRRARRPRDRGVAERVAAERDRRVRVVIDHNGPKNKPKAHEHRAAGLPR